MSCCNCLLKAKSVTESSGVTTITVADGAITGLCVNQAVEIGLFASLPNTARCNRIIITDGTTKRAVYNGFVNRILKASQYWRPCKLDCNSILVLREHQDPDLFVVCKVKEYGVC